MNDTTEKPMIRNMSLFDTPKHNRSPIHWAVLVTLLMVGCRHSQTPQPAPLPLSQRVTWAGAVAAEYSNSLIGRDEGGENPLSERTVRSQRRMHRFLFGVPDSLELRLFEYRETYWAFAGFQALAGKSGIARGICADGKVLRFLHGAYIGELKSLKGAEIESTTLFENLQFQGEDLFVRPKEFATFPLLGRIPHSERVISSHFLGLDWSGPVFTVGYKCHGDTATAFRAFPQDLHVAKLWIQNWTGNADTLDWGREIHFQGVDEFNRPLIFKLFSKGAMGFAGCFDTLLSQEYAEKMQKSAIFWPKP